MLICCERKVLTGADLMWKKKILLQIRVAVAVLSNQARGNVRGQPESPLQLMLTRYNFISVESRRWVGVRGGRKLPVKKYFLISYARGYIYQVFVPAYSTRNILLLNNVKGFF